MPQKGKIVTTGSNITSTPIGNFGARDEYVCANAQITQGITSTPSSLDDCLTRFPKIATIAEAVGITGSSSLWSFPGMCGSAGLTPPFDIYLGTASNECMKIKSNTELGEDFFGCLWGLPEAPFNCTCPEIGEKFEAYLKLRLNVATFWNTPKDAPVKRKEFLDSMTFGRKVTINISGDMSLRCGAMVEVVANNTSGYPYSAGTSPINGMYWVLGIKHMFTNTGTHETQLALTSILPATSVASTPGGGNPGGGGNTPEWNDTFNLPNNPGSFNNPFTPPNNYENWS